MFSYLLNLLSYKRFFINVFLFFRFGIVIVHLQGFQKYVDLRSLKTHTLENIPG